VAQYCFEDSPPSPTLREPTPLSADADDSVAQLSSNALVKPVALLAALTTAPALLPALELATMPMLEPEPTITTMRKGAPYPRLTIPLPGCHPTGHSPPPPGEPAGTLEQDSEDSIKSGDPLPPHPLHDVSFTPNYPLKSTRPASNEMEWVLVAQCLS